MEEDEYDHLKCKIGKRKVKTSYEVNEDGLNIHLSIKEKIDKYR